MEKCMDVLLIRNGFFAFLLPFFETFPEVSDAFQLHILKEKLMLYKTQYLEAYLKVGK